MPAPDAILTVAQMRSAEQALTDAGTGVDALMQIAGRGAGEWVWRLSGGRPVTVLCGPGNNGGDGYVIAELVRERGGDVAVIAPRAPATDAARIARAAFGGRVLDAAAARHGEVFVDCLFGSGLTRPLSDADADLLTRLAASHHHAVAIDVPSGIDSDRGTALNAGLPRYDLTLALGAWKFAHWTLPAAAAMGKRQLIGIGIGETPGAARLLTRPKLSAPAIDAHKYRRGLLGVIGGAMPGAALLACAAAQRSGAGYVRLLVERDACPSTVSGRVDVQESPAKPEPVEGHALPPDLVIDSLSLPEALADKRIAAVLVGPGLGRDELARLRLCSALNAGHAKVLDADALMLLKPSDAPLGSAVLTPHDGEMVVLERAFGLSGEGLRRERALALAEASGAVVLLKGPDSVIAASDGTLICAPAASSWLSVAGTGDVLAGIVASRLAVHRDPLRAAEEGLWLHGEAARLAGPAFTASALADEVQGALAATLT